MCGDYLCTLYILSRLLGSPPLVRGLPDYDNVSLPDRGITPACAGTTAPGTLREEHVKDHPRLCGDYVELKVDNTTRAGSPPLVRGLQALPHILAILKRITPACAGTTVDSFNSFISPRDHPRLCGDYLNFLTMAVI